MSNREDPRWAIARSHLRLGFAVCAGVVGAAGAERAALLLDELGADTELLEKIMGIAAASPPMTEEQWEAFVGSLAARASLRGANDQGGGGA